MKWLKHLHTINRHKYLVMKHCFRCGLYKQGILHDLSKYSWAEFSIGVKYFQGHRSPNIAEREDKGYSTAWLHHKGRNKHHFEYWIDYSVNFREGIVGKEMPIQYVVEMFCDLVAASKNYNGEKYTDSAPYDYFIKEQEYYIIHEQTKNLIIHLLAMLKEQGEDQTFQYIRDELLGKKEFLFNIKCRKIN